MGRLVDEDSVVGCAVQEVGDDVAHRPGGEEEGRLLAQQLGAQLLELADGGILLEFLVTDRGLRHVAAHRVRGSRRVVADQIYGICAGTAHV